MSIELKPENFNKSRKDKAKILIAQPSWVKTQLARDENQCYKLSLTNANEKFIDCILDMGNEKEVDLIVFPEFSIPEKYHEKIKEWTSRNQIIVVAGSANLKREKKIYNTASVFFDGKAYKTEKHDLSPLETSNLLGDYGPSPGTKQFYFESTPVGKLGVMICADEFDRETRNEFLKHNFDILCVIAFQPKGKDHHQSINEIVKEANEGIYVAYANTLCNSLTDGQSAFFGNEYKEGRAEYVETGLTKDDGLEMKLIEMPSQAGCLIVECNIITKKPIIRNLDPNRALVSAELPYFFENGNLRQFTKEELKKLHEKSSKVKSEYQPSIPPIKPFKAEYIGRQTDIDYLIEFLNNKRKHFLLLYGVGGMGKTHLLSLCLKDYKQKTFFFHAIDSDEKFTLNKLFEICLLPKPDTNLPFEERKQKFIEKFQENDTYLILDDYYEVQDDELKSILPKLTGIGKGKLLVLSRVIPTEIFHLTSDFFIHKLLPLKEPDFKQVIQNYILDKSITLTDEEIHLIYEKALGYPLGGQLIIDAIPYSEGLHRLLTDLGEFEAKFDPDGKIYSGRILDNIFNKGDNEEIKLLCEFSALFGASDIETVTQLPSYDLILFRGLHSRKSFVDMDVHGKFRSHAMIRDFAYYRLKNKEALHLKLAKYFENRINGRTDDDWKWLNEAILHYAKSPKVEFSSFINRVERNFESRNIKSQIDKNSILKTIRNYTTLLNLYPDKPAYYNELGIAYRMNRQHKNAIETFERALAIDAKHLPSLNELGITYRENSQKTKAIETFERALAIEPKNLKVLNELGITYRENNQKTKAIETFEKALAIEPKALPSLNELGITYRDNNQKTKAIETFERALEIDAKHLPSLNELGITYRENNQKTKAIETLERALEIKPDDVKALNELGITYRENNQKTKAIETFERASEIEKFNRKTYSSIQKHATLNLLIIYLFFFPDKNKAFEYYEILKEPPFVPFLKDKLKDSLSHINMLDDIFNYTVGDFKIYDKYINQAIDSYRSYQLALSILKKLDDKFPDNSKIKSRLGKTLSNQEIGQYEMGWKYLKQAIQIFKNINNTKYFQQHILYYLYNLKNQKQMEILENELKYYIPDLIQDADYFRFMAHYTFSRTANIDEAIDYFAKAIDIAEGLIEKREFAESLLRFLSEQNSMLYKKYFLKYAELL